MTTPLQITFRDMDPSTALDELIRARVAHLAELHAGIVSCRVVVQAPSQHHRHGQHYHAHVELSVPGHEFIADREPTQEGAQEAIKASFDAMERELKKYLSRRRDRQRADAGA